MGPAWEREDVTRCRLKLVSPQWRKVDSFNRDKLMLKCSWWSSGDSLPWSRCDMWHITHDNVDTMFTHPVCGALWAPRRASPPWSRWSAPPPSWRSSACGPTPPAPRPRGSCYKDKDLENGRKKIRKSSKCIIFYSESLKFKYSPCLTIAPIALNSALSELTIFTLQW